MGHVSTAPSLLASVFAAQVISTHGTLPFQALRMGPVRLAPHPCLRVLVVLVALIVRSATAINELSNVTLNCCVLEQSPYVMRDNVRPEYGNYSGLAIDYLARLQLRLGFRCGNIVDYSTRFPSGNFSEFSGLVRYFSSCARAGDSSNCSCDIGVGSWALTRARFPNIDYVASFSDDEYRVITRNDLIHSGASSKFFFFYVFSWRVWIAMAGLLVLHVVVTSLDSKFAPLRDSEWEAVESPTIGRRLMHFFLKQPVLFKLRHALFNSIFHGVGQSVDLGTHKTGTKERIMNLLALAMGILFITIFQASVTFQVLLNVPVSPFESIDDFRSCKIHTDRICIVNTGSASRNFWDNAIATSSCISEKRFGAPHEVSDYSDGFAKVLDGTCDYFFTLAGQGLWETTGRYCNSLSLIGRPFFGNMVSFILPKNSKLTTVFSRETLLLREGNQLQNVTEYAAKSVCKDPGNAKIFNILLGTGSSIQGWDKLQIFFYLAIASLALMLIIMICTVLRVSRSNDAKNVNSSSSGENDSGLPPSYYT